MLRLNDQSAFTSDPIWFLAISDTGPAGILRPGESGQVHITFRSTGSVGDTSHFSTSVADDSQSIDWVSEQESLRLATIPEAAWPAVFDNFVANVGTTVASYHATLAADATYLSSLGQTTDDVLQLVSFEIEKANASYTSQNLLSVTDDTLFAPGIPMTFQRSYPLPISGRYSSGMFGYGWTTNWDISASVVAGGNVAIHLNGATLYYTVQPDGSYAAGASDRSGLSLSNGSYRLTASDGTVYQFNSNGALSYLEDPHGNRITAAYNTAGQLVSLTASNGQTFTLSYNADGHVSQLTDSNGLTEAYGYDPTGQFLTSYTDRFGTTTYSYVTGQSPAQNNALAEVAFADNTHKFFSYDSQGRLSDVHRDGGEQDQQYTYLVPGGYTVTDGDGNTSTVLFDRYGAAAATIDALGSVTRYQYDGDRNLVGVILPLGAKYTLAYDANGNLASTTNAEGVTTNYTYDAHNNLSSFTDGSGNTTLYNYNSSNDLRSITYADGSSAHYDYDPLGNVTQFLNARGNAVEYTYNSQGLITAEHFADNSTYAFTYDSYGNMLTATGTAGTITYSYTDPRNPEFLTEVAYPDGTYLQYSYNVVGQRTQSVDQTGYTLDYSYNAVGQLSELTSGTGDLVVQYSYDAAGRLVRKDLGNGTRTTIGYDANGNVTSLVNLAADHVTINSEYDYTYDVLGRQTTMTTGGVTTTYGYDADGQLLSVSDTAGLSLVYTYDAVGNRLSQTLNGVTTTYAVNNLNEITSSTTGSATTSYTYDADGNLIARDAPGGTTNFSFNDIGQLTGVSGPGVSATYAYDPFGNRISQTVNGVTSNFQVDLSGPRNITSVYDVGGNLVAHFADGIGLISQVDAAGTASYYDFDASTNTVGITNSLGAYVNQYSYLPFGQVQTVTASVANSFTYVGMLGVMDDGSGTFSMGFRNYNPETGQFLSNDPLGLAGGDGNLRRYVKNNPVNLVDPGGRQTASSGGHGSYNPGQQAPTTPQQNGSSVDDAYSRWQAQQQQNQQQQPNNQNPTPPPQTPSPLPPVPYPAPQGYFWQWVPAGSPQVNCNGQTTLSDKGRWILISVSSPRSGDAPNNGGGNGASCPCGCPPPTPPTPPTNQGPDGDSDNRTPNDPNDIVGPAGFGDQNFITLDQTLPYQIDFENQPTAGLPAQQVTVAEQLDPNLNWQSFRLGAFGFGGMIFQPPPGVAFYQTRIDLTEQQGFYVDVAATIDVRTGVATWTLTTIDPATGQIPVDSTLGFLPPDTSDGIGQGFVSYTVFADPSAATGTVIYAQATITFYTQPPLDTPQIFNTIATPSGLTSAVASLPAVENATHFDVSWSGSDADNGAAVRDFTIYVSDNGGTFAPWLSNTILTSATYVGQNGHNYSFYSVASDNAGNVEPAPLAAQATTLVQAATPSSSVDALPNYETNTTFTVSWSGSEPGGPGIASYDIYVSDNGGAFTPMLSATTLTSTSFTGQDGHTYGFYSVASDLDGNTEPPPSTAQATTLVDVTPPASQVDTLPGYETSTTFSVSWSGSDGTNGSGIAAYDVFVSDNGSTFTALLSDTTLTSTSFTGVDGHTYGFYAVATDNAGNVQATPTAAQATTLVDVTPPEGQVDTLPGYETSTTFSVSWSGSDGTNGSDIAAYDVFVSDNGGTFTALLSDTTLTSTSFTGVDGHTYGFYAVATDNAGNVQATPTAAQATTLVDVTPPEGQVDTLPGYETSTTFSVSWSGSDGTNGSGIAAYDVFVSDNGSTFTALLSDTTLTSTSFTGVDGHTYGFYAVATDNAGNVQATPTAAQATTLVDVTPPEGQVDTLPGYETSTTFSVSWSGSDGTNGSGIAAYDVFVSDNGGTFTALLSDTTLTSTSFTGVDGHTYGFYAVATDNAGNVQATPNAAQATTTVAVSSVSISHVVVAEATPPRDGVLQSNEPLVITWSVTDANTITARSLTVDGAAVTVIYGPFATAESDVHNWSGRLNPLAAGTHNFTIQVTDSGGEMGSFSGSFVVVQAAGISISKVVVAEAQPPRDGVLQSNEPLVISWAVTDSHPITGRSLTVDGTAVGFIGGPYPTSQNDVHYWSSHFGPLAAGSHSFTIQMTDNTGDTTSYTDSFVVEQAPGMSISKVVVAEALPPRDGNLQSDEPLVITWALTGSHPVTSRSLTVDGTAVTFIGGPYPTLQGDVHYWSGRFGPLAAGTHDFTIQMSDSTGDSTSYSGSFIVTQAPGISISHVVVAEAQPPRDGMLQSDEPLVITWSVTDNRPVIARSLTVDGAPVYFIGGPYATLQGDVHNWLGRFGPVTAGTHDFTIEVTDSSHNTASYHGSFDVLAATGLTVASSSSPPPAGLPSLTAQQIQPIITEAERRLTAATGLQVAAAMNGVAVKIAVLPNNVLGEVVGKTVYISRNAAGYGWFLDSTPDDDAEFSDRLGGTTLAADAASPASRRVDLLTTVMHEMGHVLGFPHSLALDLMYPTLPLGERRLFDGSAAATARPIDVQAIDQVFATKQGSF